MHVPMMDPRERASRAELVDTPAVVDEVTHHVSVEEEASHSATPSMPLCMLAIVYSFTF